MPKFTVAIKTQVLIRISILMMATQLAFAEDPVDTATTVRATALRSEPTALSEAVKELATNAPVVIFERRRLWVRAVSADDTAAEGWLRFTELRFETDAPVSRGASRSGGFAGFSRSVSGFLSSFRGASTRSTQKTATIGIRGLTVAELQAAHPDTNALAAVSRYSISAAEAEQFAGAGGLSAQRVPARPGK